MVGIRPCCLSHDYICPMTIWGFYQKKPLSPVIDRESGGVTPHSGGRGCFIYTFFGVSLFTTAATPPLLTPARSFPLPNTHTHLQKNAIISRAFFCAFTRNAGGALISVRPRSSLELQNLSPRAYMSYPAEAPRYYQRTGVCLDFIQVYSHRRSCTSMFKHAHPSPNSRNSTGDRVKEELVFNRSRGDLAFIRSWRNWIF